jgi:membrane associated rhomboid family serine protease
VIPLSDENPTRTVPVITILLIIACVAIWIFVQGGGLREDDDVFTFQTAAIPCEVVEGRPLTVEELRDTVRLADTESCTDDPVTPERFPDKQVYLAILYSMFLHGSWLHLGFNMLFLWVFGNNIEDRGKVTYLGFYLVSGFVATLAHIAVQPNSTVPLVGASGAIAGVMGAYLVLYPNVRIRSLVILVFFVTFAEIRAKWLLGIWFVLQFFTNPAEGVAWVAHVGGFVFGVVVGLFWRATSQPEQETGQVPWRPSY